MFSHIWLGIFAAISIFSFTSCNLSLDKNYYSDARKYQEHKDYEKALSSYERVIRGFPHSKYALMSAQEASRVAIFQIKDYPKAVELLKSVLLLCKDQKDLVSAQRQLAEIQFEKLANYQQAIIEFNKLLEFPQTKSERFQDRMALARSYYFIGNFLQSRAEIEEAQKNAETADEKFQALFLKGSVLMAEKKVDDAISVFSKILEDYPTQSAKENVGLTLAVGYEEKGDYKTAMEILEKIKSTYPVPDFIKLKIQRLSERREQLPGAQGLKK